MAQTPKIDAGGEASRGLGLALGGGGARGLAHIAILEALDELGVKPALIARASIGALAGAAYASGIPARDIRAHALASLTSRRQIARRLLGGSAGDLFKLLDFAPGTLARIDARRLLDLFLPEGVAENFDALAIPLIVVATDYYARSEVVFEEGRLRDALAASIALPSLFAPARLNGRLLIDGGITNPVPFDLLEARTQPVFAVDVTGGPVGGPDQTPNNTDFLFRSIQIMQHQIVAAKLATSSAVLISTPEIDRFRVLDFHKADEILAAAEPAKERFKRSLDDALKSA